MMADLSPSSLDTSKSRSSVAEGLGKKIGGSGGGAAGALSLSRSEEEELGEWGGYHALGGLYKVRAWRTGTFRHDVVYGNTEFCRCGCVAFHLSECFSARCGSFACQSPRQRGILGPLCPPVLCLASLCLPSPPASLFCFSILRLGSFCFLSPARLARSPMLLGCRWGRR